MHALGITLMTVGLFSPGQEQEFKHDPAARALYDQMVDVMRGAESLSWVSDYRWHSEGREIGHAAYRIELKKPNYVRMEASRFGSETLAGVLVGDGRDFWTYWPAGKPRYGFEYDGPWGEQYEKIRNTAYMRKPAPLARHSIAHETDKLGAGMSMTILDPSTFHGYTDSLQSGIDGVRFLPREEGEALIGIEVSIMGYQRSWELWLSPKDHLPRRLRQVVRVQNDIVVEETWSDVVIDAEIPDERFAWTAPDGWTRWSLPPIEAGLLKEGTPAPDFELLGADGKTVRLSDFRGKRVWMFKWRLG